MYTMQGSSSSSSSSSGVKLIQVARLTIGGVPITISINSSGRLVLGTVTRGHGIIVGGIMISSVVIDGIREHGMGMMRGVCGHGIDRTMI